MRAQRISACTTAQAQRRATRPLCCRPAAALQCFFTVSNLRVHFKSVHSELPLPPSLQAHAGKAGGGGGTDGAIDAAAGAAVGNGG